MRTLAMNEVNCVNGGGIDAIFYYVVEKLAEAVVGAAAGPLNNSAAGPGANGPQDLPNISGTVTAP